MNLTNIIPKNILDIYSKKLRLAGITVPIEHYLAKIIMLSFAISVMLAVVGLILSINFFISFFALIIAVNFVFYFKVSLSASARVKKMEEIFPDFVQMMSSNLRAGMTVDRSFFLSARPEFAPLDKEILRVGKDIATGKDMGIALRQMAQRIESERIERVVSLIISGLKSGGNMSTLLEQTAANMRERMFIERRIYSNVLMYIIFIFLAISVGAPTLFGLAYTLVNVLINILGGVSQFTSTSVANLPFKLGAPTITTSFLRTYSIIFLTTSSFLASMILGLINTGEEKSGLKYFVYIMIIGINVYFLVIMVLGRFFTASFGA